MKTSATCAADGATELKLNLHDQGSVTRADTCDVGPLPVVRYDQTPWRQVEPPPGGKCGALGSARYERPQLPTNLAEVLGFVSPPQALFAEIRFAGLLDLKLNAIYLLGHLPSWVHFPQQADESVFWLDNLGKRRVPTTHRWTHANYPLSSPLWYNYSPSRISLNPMAQVVEMRFAASDLRTHTYSLSPDR